MYDLTGVNKYKFYIGGVLMRVDSIELLEQKISPYRRYFNEMIIRFYAPYGQCEMKVEYTEYIIVERQDKVIVKTLHGGLLELFFD